MWIDVTTHGSERLGGMRIECCCCRPGCSRVKQQNPCTAGNSGASKSKTAGLQELTTIDRLLHGRVPLLVLMNLEIMYVAVESRCLPWHPRYDLSIFSLSIRYIDLLSSQRFAKFFACGCT